jgi:hypothetical protein
VPLEVTLDVVDAAGSGSVYLGVTIVVNLHGALIRLPRPLKAGTSVILKVYITGKECPARVVHIDPDNSMTCGIELDKPRNIWGVSLPPSDWEEEHP